MCFWSFFEKIEEKARIDKADVLGWSLGSFIAQELALTNRVPS